MTLVVVTHNIPSARAIGDELALLEGGHLVARGTRRAARAERSRHRARSSCSRREGASVASMPSAAVDRRRRVRPRRRAPVRRRAVPHRQPADAVRGQLHGVRRVHDRSAAIQVGSSVRVAGMDAGEVKNIEVPPGPAAPLPRADAAFARTCIRSFAATRWRRSRRRGWWAPSSSRSAPGSQPRPASPTAGRSQSREPFEHRRPAAADERHHHRGEHAPSPMLRDNIEATIGTIQQTASDANNAVQGRLEGRQRDCRSRGREFSTTRSN